VIQFDSRHQSHAIQAEQRSLVMIESKLDELYREVRSLRDQLESERSDAELNRWFWVLMLLSATLNVIFAAR
jgi:hypothetical protein